MWAESDPQCMCAHALEVWLSAGAEGFQCEGRTGDGGGVGEGFQKS